MTEIEKGGIVFGVDLDTARNHSKTHELCSCPCCRNYYAQVCERLPELAAFLREFGIDAARPDEAMSVENDGRIDYIEVDYTVSGQIKTAKRDEIELGGLRITAVDGFVSPNEQTGAYFTLSVTGIVLPWVLDEPFPKPIPWPAADGQKGLFGRIFGKRCRRS